MPFIPGQLVAALTFPGVILHEAAHMFFCRLRKVAVLDVCFFRFGNPAGYVLHEEITDFTSAFWVAVGPLVVNSALCVAFCLPALVPTRIFGQESLVSYFWIWLGVSVGMHAFPSTHDARGLWAQAKRAVSLRRPLALLSFPLAAAIVLANVLSVVWFDAFYAYGLGFLLPETLLRRLAGMG
jgi:hypothetical protein